MHIQLAVSAPRQEHRGPRKERERFVLKNRKFGLALVGGGRAAVFQYAATRHVLMDTFLRQPPSSSSFRMLPPPLPPPQISSWNDTTRAKLTEQRNREVMDSTVSFLGPANTNQ